MAIEAQSPANAAPRVTDRTRIPMSTPRQKLSVPEIPGFSLYWMKGTPDRLGQALQSGYEYVDASETALSNHSLGGDARKDGSTDLGSRVSVIAGEDIGVDGQPIRLYLMKIKEEWHQEDLRAQAGASEKLRDQLTAGKVGAEAYKGAGDVQSVYVGKESSPNMFQPKPIRRT